MEEFACCGVSCETCPNFNKPCKGCEKIEGKPFWLQYMNLPLCPVYSCCKNEHSYNNCGSCGELPCAKIISTIDPSLSEEEKLIIAKKNAENLKK